MTQPTPTPPSLNPNDLPPTTQGGPVSLAPRNLPTSADEAKSQLAAIRQQKLDAAANWREYQAANPGVYENKTTGQGYRQTEGGISFEIGSGATPETKGVYDAAATSVYAPLYRLEQEEKLLEDAISSKYFGAQEAGMSYVESEKLKQDEAKREFTDAVARIKALYDFQDQEGDWMQENAESNAQRITDINAGKADRGSSIIKPTYMAPGTRYSDVIEPSIPGKVPPYYSMSQAVGLEGEEGLGGGISGYAKGTSFATLPSSMGSEQTGFKSPGGIDPEIAWMIGMPDVPNIYDSNMVPPLPPTDPAILAKLKTKQRPPQPSANPGFARLP